MRANDGYAVELMLVDRAGGWVQTAACGCCGTEKPLLFGLFVGSVGEPGGVVELCADCGPKADRMARRLVELLPEGTGAILAGDEHRQ